MLTLRLTAVCALIAASAFAGSATAQVRSWNFGDITPTGSCASSAGGTTAAFGNSWNCSEQPSGTVTTLQVSAFANTGTGGAFAAGAVNYQGTGSGVGAYNTVEGLSAGSPDHAVDNNVSIDSLLLSFTTAQVLKNVTLGWSGADADFQVLRWTGGALTATAGKTAAQLITAGWALVSTVDGAANISTPDVTYGVNTGNLSSSYWLISAFNSAFGSGGSVGIDAFKVLGVSTGTAVSLPGTLALAGLALAGVFTVRRRRA